MGSNESVQWAIQLKNLSKKTSTREMLLGKRSLSYGCVRRGGGDCREKSLVVRNIRICK